MIVVLDFTRFGRNVYAIGGDKEAALLKGHPVAFTRSFVYALNGCCSEIDVVVIGGILLTGGVGYVAGTAFCLLIYGNI